MQVVNEGHTGPRAPSFFVIFSGSELSVSEPVAANRSFSRVFLRARVVASGRGYPFSVSLAIASSTHFLR